MEPNTVSWIPWNVTSGPLFEGWTSLDGLGQIEIPSQHAGFFDTLNDLSTTGMASLENLSAEIGCLGECSEFGGTLSERSDDCLHNGQTPLGCSTEASDIYQTVFLDYASRDFYESEHMPLSAFREWWKEVGRTLAKDGHALAGQYVVAFHGLPSLAKAETACAYFGLGISGLEDWGIEYMRSLQDFDVWNLFTTSVNALRELHSAYAAYLASLQGLGNGISFDLEAECRDWLFQR